MRRYIKMKGNIFHATLQSHIISHDNMLLNFYLPNKNWFVNFLITAKIPKNFACLNTSYNVLKLFAGG